MKSADARPVAIQWPGHNKPDGSYRAKPNHVEGLVKEQPLWPQRLEREVENDPGSYVNPVNGLKKDRKENITD